MGWISILYSSRSHARPQVSAAVAASVLKPRIFRGGSGRIIGPKHPFQARGGVENVIYVLFLEAFSRGIRCETAGGVAGGCRRGPRYGRR